VLAIGKKKPVIQVRSIYSKCWTESWYQQWMESI